jgi:hypothetical protein
MAAPFTVYKKQEEELDDYSAKGGAKKKRPKQQRFFPYYIYRLISEGWGNANGVLIISSDP